MMNNWLCLRKSLLNIKKQYFKANILCCYEAGPTGYGLARAINKEKDMKCIIAAPGKLPKRVDRIKNDYRDALSLTRHLLIGDIKEVRIPEEEDEETKEFIRYRTDRKKDLKKIKQHLKAFLLRQGFKYNGKTSWTNAHKHWIKKLTFKMQRYSQIRDRYLSQMMILEQEVADLDKEIKLIAKTKRYCKPVSNLKMIRGIGDLTALTFCSEVGDFNRFPTAKTFMSYIGLVPSEYSSGSKIVKREITKQGNKELRRLLIESSWQYFLPYQRRKLPEDTNDDPYYLYSQKANDRLRMKKYRLSMINRKNNKVVATAVAREMAGFIWGMMTNNIL